MRTQLQQLHSGATTLWTDQEEVLIIWPNGTQTVHREPVTCSPCPPEPGPCNVVRVRSQNHVDMLEWQDGKQTRLVQSDCQGQLMITAWLEDRRGARIKSVATWSGPEALSASRKWLSTRTGRIPCPHEEHINE